MINFYSFLKNAFLTSSKYMSKQNKTKQNKKDDIELYSDT